MSLHSVCVCVCVSVSVYVCVCAYTHVATLCVILLLCFQISEEGAVSRDGRLKAGLRILEVCEHSLLSWI